MIELRLYGGPHCRLCEEAKQLIYPLLEPNKHKFVEVDITQSLELKKRYGLKIPVLQRVDTEEELEWPFEQQQVEKLLEPVSWSI